MKKFISLALALMLVMSLSVTAFAADNEATLDSNTKENTINVTGTYNAGSSSSDVISVNVSWEGLSFTYNAASEGTWQPGTHTYASGTAAGWAENNNKITVTNHSNVDVTATFGFTKATDVTTELSGSFSGTSTVGNAAITEGAVVLKAGVVNQKDNADKVEAKLSLTGSLPTDWTANAQIGTVTVSIAAKKN